MRLDGGIEYRNSRHCVPGSTSALARAVRHDERRYRSPNGSAITRKLSHGLTILAGFGPADSDASFWVRLL